MAKMERWEKYWLAAMMITVVFAYLLIFLLAPGFFQELLGMFWYDRKVLLWLIAIVVMAPFLLGYIIILLIKRRS